MSSGKLSFLLLLLFLISAVLLAGCIQPPAPGPQENTSFNLSAAERDPVREAAAEAVQFPKTIDELDDLDWMLEINQVYYQYRNETPDADYYGFLKLYYSGAYSKYKNTSLNMSYIAYLERTMSGYPFTLNHK